MKPTGQLTASAGEPAILIVEDDEPIRLALKYVIEDLGYQPLEAADGKRALVLIHDHQPALIITDLMMPRLSGADLIAAVREDEWYMSHPIPIILLSAADSRFTKRAGADAVLAKPFDLSALERLIQRFLGKRTPEQNFNEDSE